MNEKWTWAVKRFSIDTHLHLIIDSRFISFWARRLALDRLECFFFLFFFFGAFNRTNKLLCWQMRLPSDQYFFFLLSVQMFESNCGSTVAVDEHWPACVHCMDFMFVYIFTNFQRGGISQPENNQNMPLVDMLGATYSCRYLATARNDLLVACTKCVHATREFYLRHTNTFRFSGRLFAVILRYVQLT